MSVKTDEILEKLKTITLLEASELIKQILRLFYCINIKLKFPLLNRLYSFINNKIKLFYRRNFWCGC